MSLGKFKEALKDFEYVGISCKYICTYLTFTSSKVTKVRPTDKDAKAKFTECNKIVKQIAFQKAISVEDNKKNVSDSINLDAMSKYEKKVLYI